MKPRRAEEEMYFDEETSVVHIGRVELRRDILTSHMLLVRLEEEKQLRAEAEAGRV